MIIFFTCPFFMWTNNALQAAKHMHKVSIEEKPIVVVIPSYNSDRWCRSTLNSVFSQKYKNYRVIFIDDASNDHTLDCALSFLRSHNIPHTVLHFDDTGLDLKSASTLFTKKIGRQHNQKCLIIHNKNRRCSLTNLYRAIYSCPDEKAIIIFLDGDDWLHGNQVFSQINEVYSHHDVWLTHGSHITSQSKKHPGSRQFPDECIEQNAFRKFWLPSHLRTFYVALFKKIKLEDLTMPTNVLKDMIETTCPSYSFMFAQNFPDNKQFVPVSGDMAIMFPMIEMAGERHHFFSKINYVYNVSNDISDYKIAPTFQYQLGELILKKPPYKRLPFLFK